MEKARKLKASQAKKSEYGDSSKYVRFTTGHFLICYLSVLLTRLLQIIILKNKYGTEEIFDFLKHFKAAKNSEKKYKRQVT